MKIFIKCFCPENGIVLDPFFGSGVSGKIARQLNRNFIGFEKDEQRVGDFNKKFETQTLFGNEM
jgi:DNA modification methylase